MIAAFPNSGCFKSMDISLNILLSPLSSLHPPGCGYANFSLLLFLCRSRGYLPSGCFLALLGEKEEVLPLCP
jgi:hypothetical protein